MLTPESIPRPLARYAHGIEVPAGHRIILTSGQLGLTNDGSVPDDVRAQAEICLANIDAILRDGDCLRGDVVHLKAYVTAREHMAGYMEARDAWLVDVECLPTSTLVIVSGFTRPEFKVEIEAMAVSAVS